MNKKCYKLIMRTIDGDRYDVIVSYDNIATLVKDLNGTQITFIPNRQTDFDSFTVFTHHIRRIDYEAVNISPFDNPTIYEILAF